MRGPLGQVLLLILIVATGVAAFLSFYEKRSVERWQRPHSQALRQPFLAAERMFEKLGIKVDQLGALEQADQLPIQSLLILSARRGGATQTARAAVHDFVARGGHLLVESEPWREDDWLFEDLGIGRTESSSTRRGWNFYWKDHYKKLSDSNSPLDPRLFEVDWDDDGEPLLVSSLGGETLDSDQAIRTIDGDDGTRMLQLRLGDGLVTAVNDISFADNWSIGRNDNAELLWQIASDTEDLQQVAFFRTQPARLWPWLKEHAWPVMASLALLLLALLWQRMPRFGPIADDPENQRRRLSDHLAASGRFLWSAGHRADLLRAAATCAYDSTARRYPHLRSMSPKDQVDFLVRRFELQPSQAQQLVGGVQDTDLAEFLRLTRTCRHLHRQLSGAGANLPNQ